MPRSAIGQVVERESKSGVVTFAFPIRVYARAVRRKENLTGCIAKHSARRSNGHYWAQTQRMYPRSLFRATEASQGNGFLEP